ncbi:uncharacterized protein EAE98_000659 [Botrytis deweyae]|uniref:Uncharacterized protein n=1 Tax=Botrytis deweyae TaxID=2478750 RepID=A0ABQ7J3B3_9HELO|nr:uncharacterized protein EAE98_000659 [Botrytis deweyae]KAF7940532.1 hypothetical protein EAE98_000659 [Botrytis deweyae]
METPYRLPSELDFNRLRAVVTAKRLSAEDYIHDLREGPGIFADAMMEASDHRLERVLNDEGRAGLFGLPASLIFRDEFHRGSEISGCEEATQRVDRGFSKSEDLMIKLFETIFSREKKTSLSLPAIMDEIEQMIEQYLELKAKITPLFWTKLDFEYRRVSRRTLNKSVGHIFTNVRTVERTPDWIAPSRPVRVFPKSFQAPTIPQFSTNELISSFVAPREKIKPKTRGEPTSSVSIVEDTSEVLPSKPKEQIYKLKARALKVFKVLFFQPSESKIPGDLPWTEFNYAMVAMGFSVHKLDGSACQFTPPSTEEYEGRHGIQVHEPHSPGSTAKIPFHLARSMEHGKEIELHVWMAWWDVCE